MRLYNKIIHLGLLLLSCACSQDYRSLSTQNGRQIVLEQANNALTVGNCDAALEVLSPLLQSPHADSKAWMTAASAYACKGGLNFPKILVSLKDLSGQDVWSVLVKSNFSDGTDGKQEQLLTGVDYILRTSSPSGSNEASARASDANVYMVFLQLNVLATLLGPMGDADSATGRRTQALCVACTAAEQCRVQVAFAFIADSLRYVRTGAAIDEISSAVVDTCYDLFATNCPLNLSYSSCLASAVLQAQGQLMINEINDQWQL